MRRKLEDRAAASDLKRGFGGLADIEFLVQYLQLVHARPSPTWRTPNLWEALDALRRAGLLGPEAHHDLRAAYDFLRTVEGRLRIVHNRRSVDLPDDPRSSPGSPAGSTTETDPAASARPSAPTPPATPSARADLSRVGRPGRR